MSGIDVTASTIVRAPREVVAAYVTDHRNDPVWIGGITESQLEGDPPVAVGSRVRRVASFLGKRIEYVNEVVRLDPGSVLEMRSVKSPFPMVVTYSFEDADGGTRTSVRVQGDPSALYRLAGPLLARQVKRSVQGDVERLREILEKGRSS
ncbi:MAG TPA: SRPBCC family protein [Actinomycetota bacterium]